MPLITKTTELKLYVSASTAFKIDDLKSSIETIERKEIKKILGTALLAQLQAWYNDSLLPVPVLPTNLSALLHEVRRPLAHLAVAKFIPEASVSISGSGIQEVSTETHRAATKWRTEALQNQLLNSGFDAIDDLFDYLEENEATYPTWQASDEYSLLKEFFVFKTSVFNTHFNINNSRRVYISLKSIMLNIEQTYIKPALRTTFFTELKAQALANSLTTANKTILKTYIQPAIVKLTMAAAYLEKLALLDNNGVTVFRTANTLAFNERNDVSDMRAQNMANELNNQGKALLENMRLYLIANITDYPTLAASDFDVTATIQIENSPENKSLRLL